MLLALNYGDPVFTRDGITLTTLPWPAGRHTGKFFTAIRFGAGVDGREVQHPSFITFPNARRGQWQHVAITWRQGGKEPAAVYVNGALTKNRIHYTADPRRIDKPLT